MSDTLANTAANDLAPLYDAYDQLLGNLADGFDASGVDRRACVRFSVLITMATRMVRGNSTRPPAALGFDRRTLGALLGALDALTLECYATALPTDQTLSADANLDDVSNDTDTLCAQIEMIAEAIEKKLTLLEQRQNPQKLPAKPVSVYSQRRAGALTGSAHNLPAIHNQVRY